MCEHRPELAGTRIYLGDPGHDEDQMQSQQTILEAIIKTFVALLMELVNKLFMPLIMVLFDLAGTIVILLLSILVVPLGAVATWGSIPIAIFAVGLMFAIKSGLVARVIPHHTPIFGAFAIALGATVIAALGSYGFLSYVSQYPEIRAAFVKAYGAVPEVPRLSRYDSNTSKVYTELLADHVRYGRMWWSITAKDGFAFFVSSLITVYFQIYANASGSVWLKIASALVGAVLFALVIYGDELLGYLSRLDLPGFANRVVQLVADEVMSIKDLLMVLFDGKYKTFGEWLHHELIKMSGSIYKVASIYPKFILVFLAINLMSPSGEPNS